MILYDTDENYGKAIDDKIKKLIGAVESNTDTIIVFNWRHDQLRKILGKSLSSASNMKSVLDGGLRKLFETTMPKDVAADYCSIVERLPEYSFNDSTYRRSYRSNNVSDYYSRLYGLVQNVYFNWDDFNLSVYLRMSDSEIKEKNYKSPSYWSTAQLIALKIDQGNTDIINAVTDVILSENNTRAVSHELIRAVAMCHNTEMHELMKNLLLAAKLQEGLRQAILESADDGTLSYFIMLLKTTLDNDLLRFSSALRAVDVWMGLNYDYSDKRTVEKLLRLALIFIDDAEKLKAAHASGDVAEMYAAMWVESLFSIQNLNAHIEKYLHGAKYKKMVGAYFLYEAGSHETSVRLAQDALEETDMDVLTLLLQNFSLKFYNVTENRDKVRRDKYLKCLQDKQSRTSAFSRLCEIIQYIPKNGYTVSGKPFDWYNFTLTRESVYETMLVLAAYDFDDADCQRLIELAGFAESRNKIDYLNYFVKGNVNSINKAFLLDCLGDKSMSVRVTAVKMLKEIPLDDSILQRAEDLLALKTGEIRQTVLEILKSTDSIETSIKRLITDKNHNKRLGALDLLAYRKQSGAINKDSIQEYLSSMPKTTDQEAILINSLLDSDGIVYTEENGFGLYDPDYYPDLPPVKCDSKYNLKAFKKISVNAMMKVFDSLLKLIEENKDYTYKTRYYDGSETDVIFGETASLGLVDYSKRKNSQRIGLGDYVLADVWQGWFNQRRADLLTLIKISYCSHLMDFKGNYNLNYTKEVSELVKKLFGFDEISNFCNKIAVKPYFRLANSIIITILHTVEDELRFPVDYGILADIFDKVPKSSWDLKCFGDENRGRYNTYYWRTSEKLVNAKEIRYFINRINAYDIESYKKKLALGYAIGKAAKNRYTALTLRDTAFAAANGIIDESELCRAIMKINGRSIMSTYTGQRNPQDKEFSEEYPIFEKCLNYVVDRIIEIELKRGDSKTPVSELASSIRKHKGAAVFAEILVALGKETLARGYLWGGDYTKREVLSSLLKASVPDENDNAETLKAALRGRVSEKRLLEAVMYAPAWIQIAQDYLGWDGLKCGAWYFHAHTRNGFSSEFETEVARFSPIDKEDFQRGAFDINWFMEAYQTLGEARFAILYDCAKYISQGATHRRAQLFADAVLGHLNADELETQIRDKRNKDLLMSYSLIPLSGNKMKAALQRFEFINEFLKKSREFGAQRQASEKIAVEIALENLARNLGFSDVLRFNWKMEMEKLDLIQDYFKPHEIGETTLYLEMGDSGLANLVVEKKGKQLKSVPAAIKKDEYVKEISEVKSSLKAQFSRARASLEKAMCNQDSFTFEEISDLLNHPVISPLIEKLVFRSGDSLGFLKDHGLESADGTKINLNKSDTLTIAHCHDLLILGKWTEYQRFAFDNMLVQPFKQIFRELYTVNEDEKSEKTVSRRYAGNQIQPRKTVALLKGRGWTVDYENGLQKVYYKENVIAEMYALADWFSPAELEAPTLETVRFFERKTYKPLEFEQLSPVLFSEVMRDVDLVVSVAHVGGVDPMASHSTIEMRSVIVSEAARMMKLSNVTVDERHARIKGERGEYSVHLGSAIAHKMGKGALNILPVHSQHRGQLFLPFMDEDPKTAEVVSKVLLLAEDSKIKDPTIMLQINS